jgi:hypothetical protein
MRYKVIDAHSHFGEDYAGPPCDTAEYIVNASKIDIVKAIIIPAPTQKVNPCLWSVENDKVSYSMEVDGKQETNPQHPYKEVMAKFVKSIKKANEAQNNIELFPTLLIHPILDTAKHIEESLNEGNFIAIKIH